VNRELSHGVLPTQGAKKKLSNTTGTGLLAAHNVVIFRAEGEERERSRRRRRRCRGWVRTVELEEAREAAGGEVPVEAAVGGEVEQAAALALPPRRVFHRRRARDTGAEP